MSLTGLISRLLGKEERMEDFEEAAKVESMWIYPVKSCRGISVSEAPICSTASQTRPVDPNYGAGHKIKFNDAYPILLASQKSLDVLNEQLKEPVSMNRFRPNILVDGCEPYAEDFWKEIKINGLTYNSAQLCYRCKVPRVNQETAEVGAEPNETLTKFRSSENLHPDKKPYGRVYFGQTFVCNDWDARGKPKTVKVGDPVYVLKMASSYGDVAV